MHGILGIFRTAQKWSLPLLEPKVEYETSHVGLSLALMREPQEC